MNRVLYLIFVLFAFSSCKQEVRFQNNGINFQFNEDGDIEREYYIYNNIRNGVYVVYDDSNYIIQKGTYLNGQKVGMWDSFISISKMRQVLYENGIEVAEYQNPYLFKYIKSPSYDFTFFKPRKWVLEDSMVNLFWVKASPLIFDGDISPCIFIYKVSSEVETVDSLIEEFYSKIYLVDTSCSGFEKSSFNTYIYSKNFASAQVIHYNKIIFTNKGKYCLSCLCNSKYEDGYKDIFNTILNSFNPVSGCEQPSSEIPLISR